MFFDMQIKKQVLNTNMHKVLANNILSFTDVYYNKMPGWQNPVTRTPGS